MENIVKIQCRNCGAPVGYDIERQTYRCPSCGEMTGVQEITDGAVKWRRMDTKDRRRIETQQQVLNCPNCGAAILFSEGEESENCGFCGSRLIRGEFEESADFPDFVLPFVLTQEEAEKRLRDWSDEPDNSQTAEAKLIRQQGGRLTGYYLPYKLVRGPVHGRISRQQAWREYHCRGFLEGVLVSVSRQVDNAVLDAVEPFELSKLKPFEHGYIAGHKVRMPDLSPAKTKRRTTKEAAAAFLPEAKRTLHTDGIRVRLYAEDLLEIPLLLPVYVLKFQNLMAVVNGQTGRIAVTAEKEEQQSKLWRLEPALFTVLLTLLFGIYIHFYLEGMLLFAAITALILFVGYGNGRYSLTSRIIRQSRNSAAKRKSGVLYLSEGKNVLKNPFSNAPVFTEKINGEEIPVKIRFYSLGRMLDILLRTAAMIFLPYLAALFIAVGTERPFETLHIGYGAAWYVPAAVFALIYWIVGVRQDVYNHPLIYERRRNGKRGRKVGKRSQRKLSILGSFGLTGSRRLTKGELEKDEKKELRFAAAFLLFILLGSVSAILS